MPQAMKPVSLGRAWGLKSRQCSGEAGTLPRVSGPDGWRKAGAFLAAKPLGSLLNIDLWRNGQMMQMSVPVRDLTSTNSGLR